MRNSNSYNKNVFKENVISARHISASFFVLIDYFSVLSSSVIHNGQSSRDECERKRVQIPIGMN